MAIKPIGFVLPPMPKEEEVPVEPPSASAPPAGFITVPQFVIVLLLVAVIVLSFTVLVQAASR